MKLTQDELAERVRLSSHFISAIENGRVADPSLSTIVALAKGLSASIGELFGPAPQDLSPAAVEVAKLFELAPDEVQGAVVTILRATVRRRPR